MIRIFKEMPQKQSGGGWINDFMNNIKIQLKNYYIRYAIVFIAVAIIVFYPFLSAGRSFVWYKDGYQQNYRDDTYSTDRITGRINAGEKEILLLQMPFSKGWRAFVDGNRTPLYQADTMFTALILDKGEHDILLKYSTPGLKTGVVLSLVGIILFLLSLREFLPVGKKIEKITE